MLKDFLFLFCVVMVAMFCFLFCIDRTIAKKEIAENGTATKCIFSYNCKD